MYGSVLSPTSPSSTTGCTTRPSPGHLILSLRDPATPVLHPFRVSKPAGDFGITSADEGDGSELSYPGAEVQPLRLAVTGWAGNLPSLATTVPPAAASAAA